MEGEEEGGELKSKNLGLSRGSFFLEDQEFNSSYIFIF